MASVFGYANVVSSEKTDKGFCLKAKDPVDGREFYVDCNVDLPINTVLYWEHFYRNGEFIVQVLKQ